MASFTDAPGSAKRFHDGTHRHCAPAETLERFAPVARRIGVTRIADITGLDVVGMPVWVAVRPNARGLSTSQGKGLTSDAAKASAMMESIETWHAENISLPVRFDSPWAMAREGTVIDVGGLSQYADHPPRADLPMAWIGGTEMFSGRPCWVPLECVSTNYVVSARQVSESSFVQSTNGLAGGNSRPEAIAHGLAELIERDALTGAEAAMRGFDPARRLALGSVTDAQCRALLARLDAAGLLTALFDLTNDIGVPVYACAIVDRDETLRWRTLPPFSGYGCHLSPGVALLRAITEAVQSRLTYISGSRDDISPAEYRRGGNPDDLRSFRGLLSGCGADRRFDERDDLATASFDGDIAVLLERLAAAGIGSAVWVDLGKEEIGVPVTKVVVPGLSAPPSLIRGRPIKPQVRPRSS